MSAMVRQSCGVLADPVPIFFDTFEPAEGTVRATLVMVHGGAHSGSCYAVTLDGRPGWAPWFAAHGYRVLTPDWPGCGRSGFVAPAEHGGETVVAGLAALIRAQQGPLALLTHSMSGAFGWVLLERLADQVDALVAVAPAPPGNVQPVADLLAETEAELEVFAMGRRQRVSKIGQGSRDPDWVENKLVGASLFFPRERIPAYGASLLKVGHRLQCERMNIGGTQLKVADPARLVDKPVLVITGDRDRDHTRELDGAIVDWLREIGAAVEFAWLPERGIAGNGHMMMLETNSDRTAAVIEGWLDGVLSGVGAGRPAVMAARR